MNCRIKHVPTLWDLLQKALCYGVIVLASVWLLLEPLSDTFAKPIYPALRFDPSVKATTQGQKDVRTLESSKSLKRSLTGGQTHYYNIVLTSGQFLNLIV